MEVDQDNVTRSDVMGLIKQKDELEKEVKALQEVRKHLGWFWTPTDNEAAKCLNGSIFLYLYKIGATQHKLYFALYQE